MESNAACRMQNSVMKTGKRENEKTRKRDRVFTSSRLHLRRLRASIAFSCILYSAFYILHFSACNEPEEASPVSPKELPPEKNVLLDYHPIEFLTTEIESAPLLTQANHPHGWQKSDCLRCHRAPQPVEASLCSDCHGKNGVNNAVDSCQSCHKVQSEFGNPASGTHTAHVTGGPQDKTCIQCHPNQQTSKVHANGILNIVLAQGGQFLATLPGTDGQSGCTGVACHENRPWAEDSCTTCHANPPDSGVHVVHIKQPNVTCRDCHGGYQHDDDRNSGLIDIGSITYNSFTGDCTSSCHESKTLNWGCTGCHGNPPDNGNHNLDSHRFSCEECHSDHTHSYIAAIRPLDFRQATVSLARSGGYADATNDGVANGTCSGVECHTDDRTWGSSCTDCHGNPPDTSTHLLHVVQERLRCQECHADNQHDLDNRSGFIEVGGKLTSYDSWSGSCTSTCHQRETWECVDCHAFPPDSGTHVSHERPSGSFLQQGRLACDSCHVDHRHTYNAAVDARNFVNVNVAFADGGSFNRTTGTCSGTGCHEPFVWGSQCEDCHGEPPNTGAHLAHVGQRDVTCDSCHLGRQHDLDDRSGAIDVSGDFVYTSLTGDCATSCHSRVENWGCESCHGNPPLTGQHRIHAIDLRFDCRICHSDHEHSYKAANLPQDLSGASVRFTVRGVWNPATQTCTGVGCHGDLRW